MKTGDKFFVKRLPQNKTLWHLFGRELVVGLVWANGDVMPEGEFCNIGKDSICYSMPNIDVALAVYEED